MVSDSIPIQDNLTIEDIQNNIEATSPAILQALKSVDISKLSLKQVEATRWPAISFVSAYNFTRNDNVNNINPYAAVFSRNKGYNFGFTANVPILNYMNACW